MNISYPLTAKPWANGSQHKESACPDLLLDHQPKMGTRSPNQQKLLPTSPDFHSSPRSHSLGRKDSGSTRPYNYIKIGLKVWGRLCAAITINVIVGCGNAARAATADVSINSGTGPKAISIPQNGSDLQNTE